MLKGTFHNIYHALIKGHDTLSKEYCIHNKAQKDSTRNIVRANAYKWISYADRARRI